MDNIKSVNDKKTYPSLIIYKELSEQKMWILLIGNNSKNENYY